MISGHRISVVIPAGRQLTMEILINNLRRFTGIVDEVQVWHNTWDQPDDDRWLESLPQTYPGWVRLIPRRSDRDYVHPKQLNTGGFYTNTVDPDTIYFRFDDDIVYIHPDYFTNMVNFRLANPDFFLVFGHCWNNAIVSYWQQQLYHNIGTEFGACTEFCMDPVSWANPAFAAHIHNILLSKIADGTVDELFFERQELARDRQFSVSNFCYFGSDFAAFAGELNGLEEEGWLTRIHTLEIGRSSVVCGTGLVSHFSFYPQREYLLTTGILDRYRDLAQRSLEARYYQLLGES